MSGTGLEALDHSVQIAREWVNDLDDILGWNDRHRSWRLLRAVLQTLRDVLPDVEAAHLSAQLPIVLRGIFYEHWRPGAARTPWDLDRFLAEVQKHFERDPIEDVADEIEAVFEVMENRISEGEIGHVLACLPAELRALWPIT